MTVSALSPFGRGTNAPLAGRTILQIVPPLGAGGDERSTLAVAAALIDAGARALVASDSGELASEVQAVGGLLVPFPASTKNPLAMTLNVRRLASILDSERVDLVHARSRSAAWVALSACRKPRRPVVTTVLGEVAAIVAAHQLRIRGRRRRLRDRLVAIRRRPRRRDSFPAALTRLRIVRPGTGSCEARARGRQPAACGQGARRLGRRAA